MEANRDDGDGGAEVDVIGGLEGKAKGEEGGLEGES
jgi:hypothetical protein